MGRLAGEARISHLSFRSNPAGERQQRLGLGEDGAPVSLVIGIHPAAEDARVDLRQQIERVVPGLDPVQFAVTALDEAVQRHL